MGEEIIDNNWTGQAHVRITVVTIFLASQSQLIMAFLERGWGAMWLIHVQEFQKR